MKARLYNKALQFTKEGKMHQKVVLSLAVAALIVVGSVAGVLSIGPTQADTEGAGTTPSIINYQGALVDLATGDPVSDGPYDFVFSIYDTDSDGTALWTEEQTGVMVEDGLFDVMLGSVNPLSASLFDGSPRYLGITVGEDTEMTPRQLLASVPYAMNADTLDGLDPSDLEDLYVNESGDQMSGATIDSVLAVENTGSGNAIYGESSGISWAAGVWGTSSGEESMGVAGLATGASGAGVAGLASNTGDVENYGGYFKAEGKQGYGVYGIASNSGDVTNTGGYFEASGERGHGIFGNATGSMGTGVFGMGGEYGVIGLSLNEEETTNYGGFFLAGGTQGHGVWGSALGDFGDGVTGYASGSMGHGIDGSASGSSGIGVYGEATNNMGDVENYGGYFEAAGEQGRGVYGYASNSAYAEKFGGYFEAAGERGHGVYGEGQYGVSGHGSYIGVSGSSSSIGVRGIGKTGVMGTTTYEGGNAILGRADMENSYAGYFVAPLPNSYAGYFVGDVHVNGDIENPAIPIACGHVRSDGTILSGTSNIGVTWNSSSNWYEITIADEYYNSTDYVTVVTTIGTHDGKIRVSSTSNLNGKLLVFFQTLDGVAIGSSFNFVTYKP